MKSLLCIATMALLGLSASAQTCTADIKTKVNKSYDYISQNDNDLHNTSIDSLIAMHDSANNCYKRYASMYFTDMSHAQLTEAFEDMYVMVRVDEELISRLLDASGAKTTDPNQIWKK